MANPNKKRQKARCHGDLVKIIGTNSRVAIKSPQMRTFRGPMRSIVWPTLEAATKVPIPGVAATTPATKAMLPWLCISSLTYKETIGSIDITED